MKKFLIGALILVAIVTSNGCYWVFSDIQTRCVEKINMGEEISLYDKISIMTLHAGICTLGQFYCPEAATANLRMLFTSKDTIYVHSDKWLSPKVKARFATDRLGRMAWNGNVDYAFGSPEKDAAILLNGCELGEEVINQKPCYTAACDYTWICPSRTTFKITDNFSVVMYEELFYELEKIGILHPYKLVCYYEK